MRKTAAGRIPATVTDKRKNLKQGSDMASEEDALGSYTGVNTENPYETPVQDADDL